MNRCVLCLVLVSAAVALTGCGSKNGFVYGRVSDAITGSPVDGATVTLGDMTVETNEQGFFALDEVASGDRLLFRVAAEGYAPGTRPIVARPGRSTFVEISVLPWVAQTTFDVADGGTVTDGYASVTFPAGSVAATGTVTARLAVLDASEPQQLQAFPGDFTTDQGELLESFGAIAVEVLDESGALVNLASGQQATVGIPSSIAPAGMPLWYFDEEAGVWVEEGALTGCDTGLCEGTVPHLSWWNADMVLETTCLSVCVEDFDDNGVEGVTVMSAGVDYNGISTGYTGADGCACLDVKSGAEVSVTGLAAGLVSEPVSVTTQGAVTTCEDGGCQELATPLRLAPPLFQAILTWGETPSDLDSHLTGPCAPDALGCADRFHIYYGDSGDVTAAPWAWLDTDDTSSYGPEITTLVRAFPGTYRYAVHNYSGSPDMAGSSATVMLFLPGGEMETVQIPEDNPDAGLVWVVGDLECRGTAGEPTTRCNWKPVGAYRPDEEASYNP